MERPLFTVSGFVEMVNQALVTALPAATFEVAGEVSSFTKSQDKWIWFDLKDADAKISCFMSGWQLHEPLADGMRVVVTGYGKIYPRYGKFSLQVQELRLSGEGSLRRAFELLKKQLTAEGLFAPERKRSLPRFPEKVALITSREAAAYTDFLRVASARWPAAEIVLFPVGVQGEKAVNEVAAAFREINARAAEFSVVVVTRGGGSAEDLHVFNTEEVARAIFAATIPVVSGVGHERDITIADLVADVRAATPSNAAEIIFPEQETVRAEIQHLLGRQNNVLELFLRRQNERAAKIIYAVDYWLRALQERLRSSRQNLFLGERAWQAQVESKKQCLTTARRLLESLHPRQILARGYSYTKTANGRIITAARDLRSGEQVQQVYHDGEARLTVN